MRDYAKVAPQFWTGKTGKALKVAGKDAVIVGMYLMTSPHANMIGVYHCPIGYISIDTGLTFEEATKGLQSAIEADFCTFEAESGYIFVHEFAAYQIGEALDPKDNRCAGVRNELSKVPKGECFQGFINRYSTPFNLKFSANSASNPQGGAKPLGSQKQEQKQKQEKKKDKSAHGTDAPPDGKDGVLPERREKRRGSPADEKCARWLFGVVLDNNPEAKPPNFPSWADDIRLMRERDGRTHETICALFQWAQADDFWCANILSPAKLRTKWDQLTMQRARASAPKADGAWWKSDESKIAKGTELGMQPLPGESMFAFEARIRAAIDNGGKPPAPQRMSRVVAPTAPEPSGTLPDGVRAQLKALTGLAGPKSKEVA